MSIYERHNLENDELPFIYNEILYRSATPSLSTSNWHENIEIQYIYSGSGAVLNNGGVIEVSRGDISVINSNHLHALEAHSEVMSCRYLIIDRSFCLSNGIDTNKLAFDVKISDVGLCELMDKLHAAYALPKSYEYRVISIRSIVLRILFLLCEGYSSHGVAAVSAEGSISYVKRAIDYIHASYDKSFSLEDASAFVGVNKCYLSHEFHKYTGYSFVSYVNLTRCKIAKDLLRDERLSICEVANRCGFENRSYFAKTFRRYVGMLPGEYRIRALNIK